MAKRTFKTEFLVTIDAENQELPEPTLEQVKRFLKKSVVLDIDTEEHGNLVGVEAAELRFNDLVEVK